jgi:DNA-binding beta-propeller fold protein YncE
MRNSRMALILMVIGLSIAARAQSYKVTNRIPIPGDSGWDYLVADSANRQLYVSHGGTVEVVNLDTQKPIGTITGMNRIHGIAMADDLNRGFISDGGDNVIVIFDLKSHAVLEKVKAGTNPDAILFDPATKKVFAFNGRSQNITAMDAASGEVKGTIELEGRPEFPVSDGKGKIYANIEDKSEIVEINSATLKVENRWPLAPCEGPSGLAIDTSARRLFPVCSNQKMMVVDADSGKIVATVPIGNGPDAADFDAEKKLVFSPNGRDGTLTVIKQDSPDKYSVLETIPTEKSARTMALDTETHNLFFSAAQFGSAPSPTAENPHPRPKIVPDSFHVLVVSPAR